MHTSANKLTYLHQLPLFKDLSKRELQDIKGQFRHATHPRNHLFFLPDDPGEVMYILKVGRVQLYRMSPEGRKLVVAVLHPITFFGHLALIGQRQHTTYAETLDQCVVCTWGRAEVEELLLRRPELALHLLDDMGKRLMCAEQRMVEMTFKRLPARLASLLLELRAEQNSNEVHGYTHQHLADMLGTYRETVTEMLNTFQDNGLLKLGRKRVIIRDMRALSLQAEETS